MYSFCVATESDVNGIIRINRYHLNNFIENQGFLIGKCSYLEICLDLNNYYVVKSDDEICGYVHLCSLSKQLDMWNWIDDKYSTFVSQNIDRIIRIHQVAVAEPFLRKGVGSFAYKSLTDMHRDIVFSAFIVNKPYRNTASISFHRDNRFTEVAYLRANNNQYEHILMVRML